MKLTKMLSPPSSRKSDPPKITTAITRAQTKLQQQRTTTTTAVFGNGNTIELIRNGKETNDKESIAQLSR